MRVGILDTKVSGQQIDNVDLYRMKGYEIINSAHLDKGHKFDIVASTWTRINEKRIKLAGIKGIVIKDNDEPGNVVDVELLKRLKVPYNLIGLWGISTRVKWNMKQIEDFYGTGDITNIDVVIIANSPSHDALAPELMKRGANVFYPIVPKEVDSSPTIKTSLINWLTSADVVIVHLGKDDYKRYWLDEYLPHFNKDTLLISTTRGPIYSAKALNDAVMKKRVTAILDWAWEEEKLYTSNKIVHTGHSSYRSEQSGTELSNEVIKAVERMRKKLS